MHQPCQVVSLILPLGLVGLLIAASIALHRVRSLSFPISTATSATTIILPAITGVTLRGAQLLIRGSPGKRNDVKVISSRSAIILVFLLFIYNTFIATLALTYMVPPSSLKCNLEGRWAWLFSHKNAEMIQRIQYRHQCCGFNSVRDRAWHFPDARHAATACHEAFGRERSCFEGWRQDQQVTGGLMLLVAIVGFLFKVLVLELSQTHHPLQLSAQSTLLANGDERSRDNRGRNEIEYHDETSPHRHRLRYGRFDI
ncbi:hypothetical protein N7G274_003707 [Stereocaulon virgatum]|uniref:Tetraspanin Tsp3 n=1 Tax=Stereocaulon virgatum TaxID=373712 RepID=A0ABR4AEY2_9LECA